MKLLIIGNGGREHALAWKLAQSPHVTRIYVAPGNAGTAMEPGIENIHIGATDIDALANFAKEKKIELTIVGPEAPLAAGIVDSFTAKQLRCFGPSQQAAQLESSKIFCKKFMEKYHIPTAQYQTFHDLNAAKTYVAQQRFPLVIKASGLAAGKGVIIANDLTQAEDALEHMLTTKAFGEAGQHVVIEEFLSGEEASFITLVDGKHLLPLASSQDHKTRDNGDKGPNTGGMGAYSPASIITEAMTDKIMSTIIYPTMQGLQQEGIHYCGFLYAGLMITPEGEPKVLEFNCRLGDPETQPILFRLKSDLVELILAAMAQKLDNITLDWDPRPALTVVMCSGGYPDSYKKGNIITGLTQPTTGAKIFHAGTTTNSNGDIVSNGGRVLGITAMGASIACAQQIAYDVTKQIFWPNCFFRTDIGQKDITRVKS